MHVYLIFSCHFSNYLKRLKVLKSHRPIACAKYRQRFISIHRCIIFRIVKLFSFAICILVFLIVHYLVPAFLPRSIARMSSSEEDEVSVSSQPGKWVPISLRPEWADVRPIGQDEGPIPVVRIAYSDKCNNVFLF